MKTRLDFSMLRPFLNIDQGDWNRVHFFSNFLKFNFGCFINNVANECLPEFVKCDDGVNSVLERLLYWANDGKIIASVMCLSTTYETVSRPRMRLLVDHVWDKTEFFIAFVSITLVPTFVLNAWNWMRIENTCNYRHTVIQSG